MLFLSKIDDIITSFTPRSMQDLPMPIFERCFFLFYLGGYQRWHNFSFQTWLLPNMFSYLVLQVLSSIQGILHIGN